MGMTEVQVLLHVPDTRLVESQPQAKHVARTANRLFAPTTDRPATR
jgi:hypothetical protein